MEILIITGMSGAGKSLAADVLEDMDYYCVDNMPLALMPRFAEFCIANGGRYERVALVTDIRGKEDFGDLLETIDSLKAMDCKTRILFVDADTRTLIKRYKESRRPHPLKARGVTIEAAIAKEAELIRPLRERATFIVNTSSMTNGKFKQELFRLFAGEAEEHSLELTFMSFGYKHGLPSEADLVLDARFLPNPFYEEELREKTGLDSAVADFVFGSRQALEFKEKICGLLDYLLPLYTEEGKYSLTVAIGCTGGRHRSVALAAALNDYYVAKGRISVNINRDIDK